MVQWRMAERSHVLAAVTECSRLGDAAFLHKNGYAPPRRYHVVHEGRIYPSKAILAAAYFHATGELLAPVRVDGGRGGSARVLRRLGFEVIGD